jgi:hypothetical protein
MFGVFYQCFQVRHNLVIALEASEKLPPIEAVFGRSRHKCAAAEPGRITPGAENGGCPETEILPEK